MKKKEWGFFIIHLIMCPLNTLKKSCWYFKSWKDFFVCVQMFNLKFVGDINESGPTFMKIGMENIKCEEDLNLITK